MKFKELKLIFAVTAFGVFMSAIQDLPAYEIKFAEEGNALHPVVIAPGSAEEVRKAAGELADMLSRICGAGFEVVEGDGESGIAVGVFDDFNAIETGHDFDPEDIFRREEYLLRTHPDGAWLLGATTSAVKHAVWELLHRLGYRLYFPDEAWEIIPNQTDLSVDVDVLQVPDFVQRRLDIGPGTFADSEWLDRWRAANRMRSAFDPEAGRLFWPFYLRNRDILDSEPERLGFSGSERTYRGGGLCLSHEALWEDLVEYAVSSARLHAETRSVSATPGTGWDWCRCADCRAMGAPVDRAVRLANEIGDRLRPLDKNGWSVGMLVENALFESAPDTTLDPAVAPRLSVPTLLTLSYNDAADISCWREWIGLLAQGWHESGARTLSVSCKIGGPAGVTDLSHAAVVEGVPMLHEAGFNGFVANTSESWGDYGLNLYLLARLLWDVKEAGNKDALLDDFFERCFGKAENPVRSYFELAGGLSGTPKTLYARFDDSAIGRRYRLLQEALNLSDDENVRSRIVGLAVNTRIWELRARLYRASDGAEREERSKELMRLAYRARKSSMVPSYEMIENTSWYRAVSPDNKEEWKVERPLEEAEIRGWISE